jgi:hypothetical protein
MCGSNWDSEGLGVHNYVALEVEYYVGSPYFGEVVEEYAMGVGISGCCNVDVKFLYVGIVAPT